MQATTDHVPGQTLKRPVDHFPFLDHLRGIAILLVFATHAVFPSFGADELGWNGLVRDVHSQLVYVVPASMGWIGVAIFFAVSGFCIHLSHTRSSDKGWNVFFVRRFFRIYPPYLPILLAFGILLPSLRLHHLHADGGQLVSHLFLLHNFDSTYCFGINAVFWSLALEFQLYCLYPLLLALVARMGWHRTLWLAAGLELALHGVTGTLSIWQAPVWAPTWFTHNPLDYWFSWSIGAVVADAYLKKRSVPFAHPRHLVWAALVVVCYFIKPLTVFCFTLSALATAHVIAVFLTRPKLVFPTKGVAGLLCNHLRFAGVVSYSLYLIHEPIVYQLGTFLGRHSFFQHRPFLVFGFCLLAWFPALVPAYIYYRLVEMPSIAWGKSILQRRKEIHGRRIVPA
jgi:peptidoglycan/LPS O-acetylase OafA/YrhL